MKFFKLFLIVLMIFISSCSTIPNAFPTPTLSYDQVIAKGLKYAQNLNTANPDSGLHEIMSEKGVTLTAKEVQYDMANDVDKQFGLAGDAKICDYYNWGYDASIKANYFCVNVTASGGYLEAWYIYFGRKDFSKLYQDLLQSDKYIILIARIDSGFYETNQENQATGLYAKWYAQ